MKYIIDTETLTITPYKTESGTTRGQMMLTDMAQYVGTVEYEGIVETIQKWYYGSLVKAAWCATAISYFANKNGLPVTKAENVLNLLNNFKKLPNEYGTFYGRHHMPDVVMPGDICFWLWEGNIMFTTSKKHVSIATGENGSKVISLGGNQDDSICLKEYEKSCLYAIYRPN